MDAKRKFSKSYTKDPITGCWNWLRYKDRNGYGQVRVNYKAYYAHRYSYELYKGPIGDSFVLHTCDNPACCNPDHLRLGTQQDNIKDCVAKERTHGVTGRAKETLTEKDLAIIKSRLYSDTEKANILGISRRMAQRIAERLQAGLSPW
jgi:hypothetical protein